jgi:electron transfer flavoprotein beta subunit
MDIVVCVKNVPFTQEADLDVDASGKDVRKDNLVYVINEWDNYAIEEAVRIKEERGGTVTAVTLGNEDDEEVLRRCLAMGADAAVRVDPGDLEPDAFVTAALLAAVVKTLPHDLVLTGVQADDLNQGIVGALMAERLDLPHAAVVNSLRLGDGKAEITIELEGGQDERARVTLPALLSIQTGINEPRYVSIMGIRKVRSKEIPVLGLGDLGLAAGEVGERANLLISLGFSQPPPGRAAEMIKGTPAEVAQKILDILKERGGVV